VSVFYIIIFMFVYIYVCDCLFCLRQRIGLNVCTSTIRYITEYTVRLHLLLFVFAGISLLRDHLSNDEVVQRLSAWTEEEAPSDEAINENIRFGSCLIYETWTENKTYGENCEITLFILLDTTKLSLVRVN